MNFYDDDSANLGDTETDDCLRIMGSAAGTYVEERFLAKVASAPWKNVCKHVDIDVGAHVVDCAFMSWLPNVETLAIKGRHVRSLRGIAACRALRSVVVRSARKNLVALEELAESTVTTLDIEKSRAQDLQAIRRARQLRRLTLAGGDIERLDEIAGMRLSGLNIFGATMECLELAQLESVAVVQVARCAYLSGAVGPFSAARMIVQSCKAFDLTTLNAATRIEKLDVVREVKPFALADLARVQGLKELTLQNTSLTSLEAGEGGFAALRRLWIDPAPAASLSKLSANLPDCRISNGEVCFLAGNRLESVQQFYE